MLFFLLRWALTNINLSEDHSIVHLPVAVDPEPILTNIEHKAGNLTLDGTFF